MRLYSTIQDDMSSCLFTGDTTVCIHHIFAGRARRRKCEDFGFIVAISPRIHEEIHSKPNAGIDLRLKQTAQTYYEEHFGTREDFIELFLRSYL